MRGPKPFQQLGQRLGTRGDNSSNGYVIKKKKRLGPAITSSEKPHSRVKSHECAPRAGKGVRSSKVGFATYMC